MTCGPPNPPRRNARASSGPNGIAPVLFSPPELTIWGRTFRKRHGTPPEPLAGDAPDEMLDDDDSDDTDEAYSASYEGWDNAMRGVRGQATA